MIVEGFNICRQVSEETGKNYEMVKAINDQIFKTVKENVIPAQHLVVKLPEFGSWYFRKAKVNELLKKAKAKKFHESPERLEFIQKLEGISRQYDEYTAERLQKKHDKYGKENYEAYCLALKEKKLQKSKAR